MGDWTGFGVTQLTSAGNSLAAPDIVSQVSVSFDVPHSEPSGQAYQLRLSLAEHSPVSFTDCSISAFFVLYLA